jgi:hypothetical protein
VEQARRVRDALDTFIAERGGEGAPTEKER